jgi:ABC-type glycerol-3-phosphate transport system permease component
VAADPGRIGLRSVGRHVLLVAAAVVVVFPLYVTVVAALKPADRAFVDPLVPDSFTLDVLGRAWTNGRFGRYLLNSLVVAVVVTVGQVVTSLMSAYAFAMLEFRGRRVLFVGFSATLLVPIEATLVVNRRTIDALGWLNSFQGLVVPFLATAFGTFLLRQTLLALPRELRDAAVLDGAGHLAVIRHVVIPLARPTIGALALLGFLASWNQYLWPNLITTEPEMYTVQSGLRLLRSSSLGAPNVVIAGTVIAAVPIMITLAVFQRVLVRGLTAGAVER